MSQNEKNMNSKTSEDKPLEFTFINLLKLMKSEWKILVSVIVSFTVFLAVYSLIMPVQFEAEASIYPPESEKGGGGLSSLLQGFSGGGLSLGSLGGDKKGDLFMEILKSRTLVEIVISKLDLYNKQIFTEMDSNQVIDEMRDMINVYKSKYGIFIVTGNYRTGYFASDSASQYAAWMSAQIANEALFAIDSILRLRSVSSARMSRIYIEEEVQNYRQKLDSLAREIEQFQSANNVLELDKQTLAIVEHAVNIGTQLAETELKLKLAQNEFSDNAPLVQNLKKEYQILKNQYEKIQSGGLTDSDEFSIPLKRVPELIRIYADLMRDRKIFEQVIIYLETQKHQEAIQEKRNIPIVEVLDHARVPDKKVKPKRVMMVLTGFLIVSVVTIIFLIVRAFFLGKLYIDRT